MGCIQSSSATPATAPLGRGRSCAAPSSACRSSGSPPAPARRRCCGCGGPAPASSIWIWPGAPTSAGSTWSTPSGLPSRPSAGPSRAVARLSRPTAGPGWCWPATPSCAWPAPSPATSGCRGNGPDRSHGCHRRGCGAGFRGCCAHWARQRVRRNSPGAPEAGPGAAARDLPCVTQRSRSQPRDPGAGRPGPQGPPEGPSPILHARRPQSTVSPASPGLNHKLRAYPIDRGCPLDAAGDRCFWHGVARRQNRRAWPAGWTTVRLRLWPDVAPVAQVAYGQCRILDWDDLP